MKEFNEFTFNNNNTEYLNDLYSKGIIEPKIENGVVKIIVSPVTLNPNGKVEYNFEYSPKHRSKQEEE